MSDICTHPGFLVLMIRPGACLRGAVRLLSTSHGDLSTREPLPLLDSSASRFMEAALFFLPPSGGSCFLPPPPRCLRRRRSESCCLRTSCPKRPFDGGHFWPP